MTKGNGERVFVSLIFSGVSTVAVTDALARLEVIGLDLKGRLERLDRHRAQFATALG